MANYDRLPDDFKNLARVLQDFNHRLERIEKAIASLPSITLPEKQESLPIGTLTVADFLKITSISRATFYREIQTGNISVKKLGKRTLVPTSELERWLKELPSMKPRQAS